jgi:N-acetylglucosaminyldiphosphoundecaprenol N-acetyl-beta-D-mannosaminyltransferase
MIAQTQSARGATSTPVPLNIMGIPVVPFETYEQALECIGGAIESNRRSFCVAINPVKMYNALHEPQLYHLLQEADINICDGAGVSLASRILCGRRLRRITGCDLFFRLLSLASERQWGVYLLGASPQSNAAAQTRLHEMFPDLRIVGRQDGFFKDSAEVVERINASGADLLFVAMGSPKQEYWIWRHRREIHARFCMGVGGSLDIASGHAKRAPRVFRMTGTEFLFRFALEPRKRLLHQKILFYFLLRILGRKLSGADASMGWT